MFIYSIENVSKIIQAPFLQLAQHTMIDTLLFDSRRVIFPETSLYFAINGPRRRGIDYVGELYQIGVRNFVVQDQPSSSLLLDCREANFLLVEHAVDALQQLAIHHRANFSYPVIGITGSNGKTIIKEWLYQLLTNEFNIVRSPKSYNSQIGVPLSVWQMGNDHTLGIFEAGISQVNEMNRLQKIIDPSIGILGFIGDAHAEGFANLTEKIKEKCLLFKHANVLIYCSDDHVVQESVSAFVKNQHPAIKLFSWSRIHPADFTILNVKKNNFQSDIFCEFQNEQFSFTIPFLDDASVFNAITCCAVMLYLKKSISDIKLKMLQLKPLSMRLELKQGINQCAIINDSYNADIESLKIALDFLHQQDVFTKKTIILSDILEVGKDKDAIYVTLSKILSEKKLFRLIGIGSDIYSKQMLFHNIPNTHFYHSTDEFLTAFPLDVFRNETILLKGARVFQFEKIHRILELKIHDTVLEINLTAIRNNLKKYKQLLREDVKLMCMVKAFSYGSGSHEIANILQHEGVEYLAVAYTDEGVELRKAGVRIPIMVMNPSEDSFSNVVKYQLEPELYSVNILNSFDHFIEQNCLKEYPVHIKLDTGMHRLGFTESDIGYLRNFFNQHQRLKIKSIFSHLIGSEDPNLDFVTQQQSELFNQMTTNIGIQFDYPYLRHLANTAAIQRHPTLQYDMVRLGIGLYGVDNRLTLQNVTTLKTTIAQIKKVKKGERVGYGNSGLLKQDADIATVRIGYADGYARLFSDGVGKMLVNGKMAPVVGKVCMDMTMLDITNIEAKEGDEVIVFGEALPVKLMSNWSNTISYEILTNISQRVKRLFYEE